MAAMRYFKCMVPQTLSGCGDTRLIDLLVFGMVIEIYNQYCFTTALSTDNTCWFSYLLWHHSTQWKYFIDIGSKGDVFTHQTRPFWLIYLIHHIKQKGMVCSPKLFQICNSPDLVSNSMHAAKLPRNQHASPNRYGRIEYVCNRHWSPLVCEIAHLCQHTHTHHDQYTYICSIHIKYAVYEDVTGNYDHSP